MLLLLHEEVGSPAPATTLLHTLGAAVLADLALLGRVGMAGPAVVALGDRPPPDALLRSALDMVAAGPARSGRSYRSSGLRLWRPVTDRLVERGRIRRERKRTLGLHPVTTRPVANAHDEAELRAHLRTVQESAAVATRAPRL